MSRAPTAAARAERAAPPPAVVSSRSTDTATIQEAEPAVPMWSPIADQVPHQQIVFVTADPDADDQGTLARFYSRRKYVGGRWEKASSWVEPVNLLSLDPQPTHWRPDPAREMLDIPIV